MFNSRENKGNKIHEHIHPVGLNKLGKSLVIFARCQLGKEEGK